MKPPAKFYSARPDLEDQIAKAAASRKRLVLRGRVGAGRFTALTHALPRYNILSVDLRTVFRTADLDVEFSAFTGHTPLRAALQKIDSMAKRKRTALVVRNLDGCRGVEQEAEIVGALRSELQGVQEAAVFYTATDDEFLERHLGDSRGSFYKQAVIVDVPDLDVRAVDMWTRHSLEVFLAPNVRAEIVDKVGLCAGDLELFFDRAAARWSSENNTRFENPDVVRDVCEEIVRERSAIYSEMLAQIPPRQRAVLMAGARGVEFRATNEMAKASEVPVASIVSALRSLVEAGWLVSNGEKPTIADPFFRLYMRGRRAMILDAKANA